MNKMVKISMATVLAVASASASAWWGNNDGWDNDGFGDFMGDMFGDMDFNFNMHARGDSYGRGYGYNRYNGYDGYAPYGYAPLRLWRTGCTGPE
ncbi:sulfur globule family protein [Thiolapillus sp.]|uniref:sulfur globule family protein n=2 Tax=Thiolapillus sp. TaxID=2017437 RepID=UPI003AF77C36